MLFFQYCHVGTKKQNFKTMQGFECIDRVVESIFLLIVRGCNLYLFGCGNNSRIVIYTFLGVGITLETHLINFAYQDQ